MSHQTTRKVKKKTSISLRIKYIYIDYQWRKDSKHHVKHLINLLDSFQEKIHVYQVKRITSSEHQARTIRYQILMEYAIKNNYNHIITAHTNTDKLETFFIQLFRGSSLEGITSLNKFQKITENISILRPLLIISRKETYYFCRLFSLPIWSDISNYNYKTYRNRIRHELIPYLNKYFGKHTLKHIHSFISTAHNENEYIKQNALKLYLIARHKKYIALNSQIITKQHSSIKTRTIYIFFYHNFNKILDKNILYKLIYYLNKGIINKKTFFWHNIKIHLQYGWIYIN